MNVLFFSPVNIYSNLAEIELELMQRHLDDGDTLHLLICNGEVPFCEINKGHSRLQCRFCKAKHLQSASFFSDKIIRHQLKNYFIPSNTLTNRLPDISTIEDLKEIWLDEYMDIGYCIASYLISEYRDPEYDIISNKKRINTIYQTVESLYCSLNNFFKKNKIDLVYVWNGRMPTMRPVIRSARKNKINFCTYNTTTSLLRYDKVLNHLHHDLQNTSERIIKHWNASTDSEEAKINIANNYYNTRTVKKESNIELVNVFIQNQDATKLPDDWDRSKINIAIFNSSEDEMASISDEWKNHLYKDQYDGICQLLTSVENDNRFDNYHFYLRIHPNLADVKNADTERILALSSPKLTIIPGSSPVSTYLLIKESSKTVTFGSSAGIEAVFMEKPSILIGKCFYRNLPGGTYQPASHNEFIEMLLQPLPPLDKTAALMYGYFWATFGTPLKYVTYENGQWLFKGKKLRSHFIYEGLKTIKGKIKK